jgi:long-chain acyl-CoA synthetase
MQSSNGLNMTSLRANLLRTVRQHPERPAVTYAVDNGPCRRVKPDWHTLTWHEFALLVAEVADGLEDLCPPGSVVAVLAATDARYPILEQAVIVCGRRLQPLYTSTPDAELLHALKVTGANVLVVGDDQWARMQSGALADATLQPPFKMVELSALVRLPNTGGRPPGLLDADTEPFDTDQVRARLSKWPERREADAVLYLQSSGTTGPSDVIEISQQAILAAMEALPHDVLSLHSVLLSYLPTAHISERLLIGYLSAVLAFHVWFGGGTETLGTDLSHCRPTVFLAPPLVLEAIRSEATAGASTSLLGRCLLGSAAADAERTCQQGITGPANRRLRTRFFGWLVRRKSGLIRAKIAISGTAPLAPDLQAWWETLGLPLRNVYGQTELSGATSMTEPRGSIRGGVGRLLPGVEVKVAVDGELLVRSPSLFTRYVGAAEKTAHAFESGWFKTGDRARLSDDGELLLLGRSQSMVPIPGAGVADMTDLTRRITRIFGHADVAYFRDEAGVYLYVAIHPEGFPRHTLLTAGILDPIPDSDGLAAILQSQLNAFAGQQAIVGYALFRGGFGYGHGEVGPTGKLRGWRIHQLRSAHLRRRPASDPEQGWHTIDYEHSDMAATAS